MKKRELRLPDIEALRKPSRMISDVHAIARTTTITVILLGLRNFSGFYIILITAIVVIDLPTKVIPAPPLRLFSFVLP